MFINPIVAEVYQNTSGNVSGLAGVLHNTTGQISSYFYISISVSTNAPVNRIDSDSCIDIAIDNQTYTVICELDTEILDSNFNNDQVIVDNLYHTNDHGNHIFNYIHFKIPVPVWIVINGLLLSQK